MGGEMRHLVGIREHGDARAGVPETGHSMDESLPSTSLALGGRAPPPVHGSASVGRGVSMQVDVLAVEQMKVMWASPTFIQKYGSARTFEELLPNPQEFRQWLIRNADAVWSGDQSPGKHDFGGLVVGKRQQAQLRLVKALFLQPEVLDQILSETSDRSTYRVSVRFEGRLSGGSDSSSDGNSSIGSSRSSRSRGTSPRRERLSLDRIQARPAPAEVEPSLPLELAQLDLVVRTGVVRI